MSADDKINQPDPIHKAASLAAWGALRQRHYATVDEVFDALASDVVAAVRPLIEEELRAEIAQDIKEQGYISGPHFDSEDFDEGIRIATWVVTGKMDN